MNKIEIVTGLFFTLCMVLGTVFFFAGFHNIDNAQNLRTVNYELGEQVFIETSIAGVRMNYEDSYSVGVMWLFLGWLLSSIGSIMFIASGAWRKDID